MMTSCGGTDGGAIAVFRMMDLSDDAFELPPDTIQGVARELITGVYKLENGLLLILDTTKVVNLDAKLFG